MSEQQYRVIADRDKGDDPQLADVQVGDRFTYLAVSNMTDRLVRIERPVPNTDEAKRMLMTHPHDGHGANDTCRDCEANPAPSLPTREQIAEAISTADDNWMNDVHPNSTERDWRLHLTDAVFALLQKAADR